MWFYSRWFILFFVLPVFASERFSHVDLWLPKAYQRQYTHLLKAAEKAETDPYCYRLLSGRLIESLSTADHLFFSFRCRTEENTTFSLQVDGKTLVVTNDYAEKKKALEQRKMDREKEKVARLLEEQHHYWDICEEKVKEHLERFDKAKILTKLPPKAISKGKFLVFKVDFDAQSQSRRPIHFIIRCDINEQEEHKLKVKRRRVASKTKV